MRVIILYRPRSEHASRTEAFVKEFTRLHPGSTVELADADDPDGAHKASVYGVVQYPAVLALASDGRMLQQWSGEMLPLMNEVAYYANT